MANLGADGVIRLPDAPVAGAPAGRWWPPAMVDPAWIERHAGAFDVMHLHFGLESFGPDHLAATVAALRRTDKPLVFTVHDLENPQLHDQTAHRAALDVVVPAADALVTLTPGAAAELAARWGRRADVVPHPHLHPIDLPIPPGRASGPFVVGLHARDLRPGVDGPGATGTLLAALGLLRATGIDVHARIELHDHVRDPEAREAIRRTCASDEHATLVEAPRPDDAALAASLADLDVSVLPYRHGTHSGWVELCWDLGVCVAAPNLGHLAEQHPDPTFLRAFDTGSPQGLAGAIGKLLGRSRPGSRERGSLTALRRTGRRRELGAIGAAHLEIYRRVLAAMDRSSD